MKIGIPRGLLYYRYQHLWERFFKELNIDFLVSPETNKAIVRKGTAYAIDESCLSSKIFLGHVEWLLDKCDFILIPRLSDGSDGTVCTKFQALYDVVTNTFRDQRTQFICLNLDPQVRGSELASFSELGYSLGKKKHQCLYAYLVAKQAQKRAQLLEIKEQERLLSEPKIKILLLAHSYNACDHYLGEPILSFLRKLGTVPIRGHIAPRKEALAKSALLSETLPWAFNKELVGSIPLYQANVDGLILISSFPCGPDSLVNEILVRRIKHKPILNLVLDGQEGNAGLETRLESFVDIIRFKKDGFHGEN